MWSNLSYIIEMWSNFMCEYMCINTFYELTNVHTVYICIHAYIHTYQSKYDVEYFILKCVLYMYVCVRAHQVCQDRYENDVKTEYQQILKFKGLRYMIPVVLDDFFRPLLRYEEVLYVLQVSVFTVCMYVCMCVCMYVCMYVCIHIYQQLMLVLICMSSKVF